MCSCSLGTGSCQNFCIYFLVEYVDIIQKTCYNDTRKIITENKNRKEEKCQEDKEEKATRKFIM